MPAVRVHDVQPGEDLYAYLARTGGDEARRRRLIGAANEFKEGDAALGLAAADLASRTAARALLANTAVGRLAAAYALAALLPAPKPVRPGRRREFFLRLVGIRPNAGIAHRPVVGPSAWPSAESRAVRRERRRRQLR